MSQKLFVFKFPAFFLFSAMLLLFSFFNCSDSDDEKSNAKYDVDSKVLVSQAMKGSPVFQNSKSPQSKASHLSISEQGQTLTGSSLERVYSTFKYFDSSKPTFEQDVDGSNIWVSISGTLLEMQYLAKDHAKDFDSPTIVNPTFNLIEGKDVKYSIGGTQEKNYRAAGDKWAFSSFAANITDSTKEMVMAINSKEDGSSEAKSITYFKLDTTTNELLMDINYLVQYTSGPYVGKNYTPRLWVRGNIEKKSFEVMACNYSPTSFWSMVSAGVNTGADEYMIMYFEGYTHTGWYKIPADTTVSHFEKAKYYDTLDELISAEKDPKGHATKAASLYTSRFKVTDVGTRFVSSLSDFKNENKLDLPK